MYKMEVLKVKNVLVDKLLCDKCGAVMELENVGSLTYPALYSYICPDCHSSETTTNKTYPAYYLELSDGTMLQL